MPPSNPRTPNPLNPNPLAPDAPPPPCPHQILGNLTIIENTLTAGFAEIAGQLNILNSQVYDIANSVRGLQGRKAAGRGGEGMPGGLHEEGCRGITEAYDIANSVSDLEHGAGRSWWRREGGEGGGGGRNAGGRGGGRGGGKGGIDRGGWWWRRRGTGGGGSGGEGGW